MKALLSTCVVLASLAWPALAKDIALPAKDPAITLTIPDDWDTSVYETELSSVSPDGNIVLNVATDDRSSLGGLVTDSKAYLKKNKVVLTGKPTEQTIDYSGTPGRVQRYAGTDKNGKTIVDLVTLDASRNRAALITVWGSQADRETDDAALAAIMRSVKVPAGTGSFWSGGSAQGAKPEPAKPEQAKPEPAKPEPTKPAAAAVPEQPFAIRKAVFVVREASSFGDVEARPSQTFVQGEKLRSYIEPVGETMLPGEPGKVRFGVIADFEVRTKAGEILAGQKGLIDKEFSLPAGTDPMFYLNSGVTLTGIQPGEYVLTYMLEDKLSKRLTRVDQPFTIAAAAAAAAPANAAAPAAAAAPAPQGQPGGTCAKSDVKQGMMETVNGAPAFQDGSRRLTDLIDPETVLDDQKAKLLTCRYTALWAEKQSSGTSERRMKMTFKVADDGKGGIDLEYLFDK